MSWAAHARGAAVMSLLPAGLLLVLLPLGFRAWRQLKFDSYIQRLMLSAAAGAFYFVDFRDGSERLYPGFPQALA